MKIMDDQIPFKETLKKKIFLYSDLITGLKEGRFKNVVVFTGPGIGVHDYKSEDFLAYLENDGFF